MRPPQVLLLGGVLGLEFRVYGLGFRVCGLGFRVKGVWFGGCCLRVLQVEGS